MPVDGSTGSHRKLAGRPARYKWAYMAWPQFLHAYDSPTEDRVLFLRCWEPPLSIYGPGLHHHLGAFGWTISLDVVGSNSPK